MKIGGAGMAMQGGHHPHLKLEFFEELFSAIKARSRSTSIPCRRRAESVRKCPASRSKRTVRRLKAAGWDYPGGGAEILVQADA